MKILGKFTMENYSKYHTGFALLRILCAFSIVFCHFYNVTPPHPYYATTIANCIKSIVICGCQYLGPVAVPVFIIMSFYLVDIEKMVCSEEPFKDLLKRLWRLYFPVVFFSLLYYLIFAISDFCFNTNYSFSFFDLILQLCFGSDFNPPMWYWIDLIWVTFLIFLVFYLSNKINLKIFYALIFLFFGALLLQYSEVNFKLFKELNSEMKWTLGRFVEIVPYAVIGILFRKLDSILKRNRIKKIILLLSLFFISFNFSIPLNCNGFYYQGINILLRAMCVFLFFLLFDLLKFDETIKKLICYVSTYSGGIICFHYLVNSLITNLIFHKNRFLQGYNFNMIIIIYFICLLLCFLFDNIPVKFIKKAVR